MRRLGFVVFVGSLLLFVACMQNEAVDLEPLAVCSPSSTPIGALPPTQPVWCTNLGIAPKTFTRGINSWEDDFDANASMVTLGQGYSVFDKPPQTGNANCQAEHFRHNNHWMVDLTSDCEGTLMRPNKRFKFEDGKLVIEVDVAAGIPPYGQDLWPEIDITTAPRPLGKRRDGLYAYDSFPGHWTLGCRLESDRTPTCALFDASERGATNGGRVFEISFFQHEDARRVYGGEPGPEGSRRDRAWNLCGAEDPDINCRDRFRWEISKNRIAIYVNGVKYMEHRGFPRNKRLPNALVKGKVYVYFSSWGHPRTAESARFHWDRIAINP